MKPTVRYLVCKCAWYTFGMKFIRRQPFLQGFTLIELLVTIAILTLLVSVIAVSSVESSKKSRDAERQADLRALQSSIELYKNKYGRYPEQCAGGFDGWSGQKDTSFACDDNTNHYILGATGREFSEFVPVLPTDPKLNEVGDSGYIYRTNTDGTVFKLKAHRTVESEKMSYKHELKACDIRVASSVSGNLLGGSLQREVIGWCGRVHPGNSLPDECKSTNDAFKYSYGVWGGFEPKRSSPADPNGDKPEIVQDTTAVICE